MSDVRFAPVDAPVRAKTPSKLWRNEYRVGPTYSITIGDACYGPNEPFVGPTLFPSKEIAEQRALDFLNSPKWTPRLKPGDVLHERAVAVDGEAP